MRTGLAMGIDAGGTKLAALIVECGGGEVLDRALVRTPDGDAERIVEAISSLARGLLGTRADVEAVGIGAAGMIDRTGVVRFSPNIAWRDTPLGAEVGAAVGLPTFVENDANAAAWGEYRFGAGRGADDMLLVTVGTGIGGGIVIGGRLFRGAHGLGAEIGHVIVDPEGPLCGCGNHGCWEQMASGRAIDRLGKAAAREHPDSALARRAGGDPERVTGVLVTDAARDGDAVAIEVMEEVGRRLGRGIAGLVNVLDPDVVVVGGGAIRAGDLLLGPARAAFADTVMAPGHRPPVSILAAAMGNDAGAVGAADLALQRVREEAGA